MNKQPLPFLLVCFTSLLLSLAFVSCQYRFCFISVRSIVTLAPHTTYWHDTYKGPQLTSTCKQINKDGHKEKIRICVSIGPFNPFTPKSDQVQISPVASPVIWHHTVWRTWLFIAYSDWKMILVPVLTTSLIHFSLKGWENVLFELGSERVNKYTKSR